jgi:type IV secretion system protein VirB3
MRGTPALYFSSLNRPFTIMGVDRKFFFFIVGLCLPIAFTAQFLPIMDAVAGSLFLVGYSIGLLMTRADPYMFAIYQRHIRYRKYYAPQSGIHARLRLVKPSVPVYQGKRGLV